MKFEVLDHVSDVGLRFFGHSFKALLNSAMKGTAYLIGDRDAYSMPIKKTVRLRFKTPEDLMIQILAKVVYFFDTERIILNHAENIPEIFPGQARITLTGYKVGPKFNYRYLLKSPTYYDFFLSPEKGYGEIIYDI